MKYAVDRIVEDIVVLENIESGEILEVNKKELPDVYEGSIVVKENDQFTLDLVEEESRRESIRERLERLKKLKK